MIESLISGKDGYCLRQVRLREGHPIIGTPFSDVLATWYADGRVVGLIPVGSQSLLENRLRDFATHFLMCPGEDHRMQPGDELVLITTASTPSQDDTARLPVE